MASFEDKVEALRRLRERRQARAEPSTTASTETHEATEIEGKELIDALSHYANLPESTENFGESPLEVFSGDELSTPTDEELELQKAAAQEASALYCLGHCHEQGLHECERDVVKAAMYYHMAADKGNSVAQWRLGHLYEFGLGVDSNDTLASHWYRLAAEAGHAQAQSSLALFLEDGRGGPRDDVEALHWHLSAANQGQSLSQYCVACCLSEGRGASKDDNAARTWLEKSANGGFPAAIEALACSAKSCTQFSEDAFDEDVQADESIIRIAERLAKQMGNFSDEEASVFLDELLDNLQDSSSLDRKELTQFCGQADLSLTC